MTPNQYLTESGRTECNQDRAGDRIYELTKPADPVKMLHSALGMMNELGEITSVLQKWIWYGKEYGDDELRSKLKDEYGDLAWHFAQGLRALGLTFEAVWDGNIKKLIVRYPDAGWSAYGAEDANRNRVAEAAAVELCPRHGSPYNCPTRPCPGIITASPEGE